MIDVFELPFDQYQRYRLTSDLVNELRAKNQRFTILDVGGRTGLLRSFLPKDHVSLVDLEPSDQKGLVLGDYNNLYQLGGFITDDGQLGNIIKVSDHLVRGKKGTPPVPKVRKISELTFDDVNTLVTVTDVQFLVTDTAFSFADPVTRTTYNRNLEDCDAIALLVRTSGYADFAGVKLPKGGGTLTGRPPKLQRSSCSPPLPSSRES